MLPAECEQSCGDTVVWKWGNPHKGCGAETGKVRTRWAKRRGKQEGTEARHLEAQ